MKTLRAKGTLIREPQFSDPCAMRFFPSEKGKTAFSKKNPRQRPFSLSRVGKIGSRKGSENRGSLISVPLALRELFGSSFVLQACRPEEVPRNLVFALLHFSRGFLLLWLTGLSQVELYNVCV